LSDENIATASRFSNNNADWIAGDYLRFQHGVFDLILCERSLHLFPYPDAEIAAKLASDLAPDGIAAISIPASCACTFIRIKLIRALRRLRSPFLDNLIVHVMRLLRPQLDLATLRDRLPYLYALPRRIDSSEFRATLSMAGLEVRQTFRVLGCGLSAAPHSLMILAKLV
jgi:hypothetical protein